MNGRKTKRKKRKKNNLVSLRNEFVQQLVASVMVCRWSVRDKLAKADNSTAASAVTAAETMSTTTKQMRWGTENFSSSTTSKMYYYTRRRVLARACVFMRVWVVALQIDMLVWLRITLFYFLAYDEVAFLRSLHQPHRDYSLSALVSVCLCCSLSSATNAICKRHISFSICSIFVCHFRFNG